MSNASEAYPPHSAELDAVPPPMGKVLVAEDIKTNRIVLCQLLQSIGLETLEAENGQQALTVFKSNPSIKMVFMDMKMPVLDGVQATLAIRELELIKAIPTTPIIAVTAFDHAEDIKRCMDAGMNDVMYKPAVLKTLITFVDKYCHLKNISESLALPFAESLDLESIWSNRHEIVFNKERLSSFVSGQQALAVILIHGLMNDLPNYLNFLRTAVMENNGSNAQAVLHVLQSLLQQIGAEKMSCICQDLNKRLKSGVDLDQTVPEKLVAELHLWEEQFQLWSKTHT